LRPKEIQARIRAGETVEEIADAAGIAVERVRWFEGPVLAERAHMADLAQNASVRRHGDSTPSGPGPRLGDIVAERLKAVGAAQEDPQWDARKLGDGTWLVQLAFTSGGRLHLAEWVFDPRRRHVMPADDNAARMSLPGAEPPLPAPSAPGEATVTRLAPRLSSGHGPAVGWTRHDRPGPGRPATPAPEPPAAPEPAQPPLVASADAAGEDYPPSPAPAEKGAAPAGVPPVPAAPVPSVPVAEHAARQSRKTARSKRSSVPSWDEIMFGSTRQRD
jgi:Protein of unknown function (DUF3071)